MKTHQIFISSYKKDFPWLRCCLASIDKYQKGFLPPIVCVTSEDSSGAYEIVHELKSDALIVVKDGEPGYLRAQIAMMSSDTMTNADYIYFVGSDCMFYRPFNPSDYFWNDKPVMLITSYDEIEQIAPQALGWRRCVTEAIGFTPKYEFMRRLPLVYPRKVLEATREKIQSHNCRPFEEYVYSLANKHDPYTSGFSESNVIGAFAYQYMHNEYEWIVIDNPMIQFWSHGGFDRVHDSIAITPRQAVAKFLGPNFNIGA